MPVAKKPAVAQWEKDKALADKEKAEMHSLQEWFTDAYDAAILNAPQDFTSSTKAQSYGRQEAKKAEPKKFARLRELENKYQRMWPF